MILANEYKSLKKEFREKLRELLENSFYSDIRYYESPPSHCMQYWKIELTYFFDSESLEAIDSTVGYFTVSDIENIKITINDFFRNNDKIVDEFFQVHRLGDFNSLASIFLSADQKDSNGVSINIAACNNFDTAYMRYLCEEYLIILYLDEKSNDKVGIDCQCSERYKIKIVESDHYIFLNIPYEKVSYFPNAERVEGINNRKYYEYEVALSFAGEDRNYVEQIAQLLKKNNIRVFYDYYEKSNLWGKDLYVHLDNVYRHKSKFCVLFLSVNYKQKVWTDHERKSAQARAFKENDEYILPVKLDDTEIDGIRPTLGYLDGREESPKSIVEAIKEKIYA